VTRLIDKVALAIGVALLALGPLALTLTRADSYHSTAVVSLNTLNPGARYVPDPRGLLAGPLKVKDVQRHIAKDVGWFDTARDLPKYVQVTQKGAGAFAVTARGPGNHDAQELATATARRLREAAELGATFTQTAELKRLKEALKRDDLTAARRDELLTRRKALGQSVRTGAGVYAPNPPVATLESERIGDRALGALPGDRSFRPNLLWVTVAGVSLAMALALWALALGPLRSRGRSSTPG
jgi:hypothetical protein